MIYAPEAPYQHMERLVGYETFPTASELSSLTSHANQAYSTTTPKVPRSSIKPLNPSHQHATHGSLTFSAPAQPA